MRERVSFGMVFLLAFAAGILTMSFGKSILLDNTGLLSETMLSQMSTAFPDSDALFVLVLRKRISLVVVMAVMATTYLGMASCIAVALWYGFSAGMFLTAAILRFGFKGILLVAAGVLPQYFLYVPAVYALLMWCDKTCRMIYYRSRYQGSETKAPFLLRWVLPLVVIIIGMLAGCFLESFVNPQILQGTLKLF